jgi:hypothetical protein
MSVNDVTLITRDLNPAEMKSMEQAASNELGFGAVERDTEGHMIPTGLLAYKRDQEATGRRRYCVLCAKEAKSGRTPNVLPSRARVTIGTLVRKNRFSRQTKSRSM